MQQKPLSLSAIARRQRKLWGITWMSSSRLPYYTEAEQSVYSYRHVIYEKEFGKLRKHFPVGWSDELVAKFLEENNHALNEYQDEILQAAQEDNTDFFIILGKTLERQRAAKLYYSDKFEPHDCISYTAYFWTEGLLWLMSDKAALDYFKLILGKTFSLDAYRKAKARLHVVQHPDSPIISIKNTVVFPSLLQVA